MYYSVSCPFLSPLLSLLSPFLYLSSLYLGIDIGIIDTLDYYWIPSKWLQDFLKVGPVWAMSTSLSCLGDRPRGVIVVGNSWVYVRFETNSTC